MILTAALAVGLTSCKKDEKQEENPSSSKSKVEILTSGEWDIKYFYTKTVMADTVAYEETDTLNGTVLFKSNKEMVSNMQGEPTDVSNWDLQGDSIFLDGQAMFIEELTNHKFVFSNTENSPAPDSLDFSIYMEFTLTR